MSKVQITIRNVEPDSTIAIYNSVGEILFVDRVFWDKIKTKIESSDPSTIIRVRKHGFLPQEVVFHSDLHEGTEYYDFTLTYTSTLPLGWRFGPLPIRLFIPEITSIEIVNGIMEWAKGHFSSPVKRDVRTPDIIMIKSIGMIKCSNPVIVTRKEGELGGQNEREQQFSLEHPKLFDKLEEFFNG